MSSPLLHQQENNVPDSGVPFVDGRPAPVPRDLYYGLASDRQTTNDDIGTVRFKHDFDASVSIADTFPATLGATKFNLTKVTCRILAATLPRQRRRWMKYWWGVMPLEVQGRKRILPTRPI